MRNQVRQLRAQLSPEDALTEEQNRELTAALQEERLGFNEDVKQRAPGERIGHRSLWEGATLVADSASSLSVPEQYLQQAEEFSRRQRQRATGILTVRQLRVFEQMQAEMLIRERLEVRTTIVVEQVK